MARIVDSAGIGIIIGRINLGILHPCFAVGIIDLLDLSSISFAHP
tara:strand:+ start:273 stop:407 length:135 start_codon:yes stop_codon:yes gene_type:complete